MPGKLVPTVRTRITLADFTEGLFAAWHAIEDATLSGPAAAVFFAQVMHETGGGEHCYGHNLGNVKWTEGAGTDYHCLKGVWEGVTPAVAAELIRTRQATLDPSPDHQRAVDPSKIGARVSVVFEPPHPATRFRAYPSLPDGLHSHLRFLRGAVAPSDPAGRYALAWQCALAGDVVGFAVGLKRGGYFTADAAPYARRLAEYVNRYLAAGAFDEAPRDSVVSGIHEAPAQRNNPRSEEVLGSGGILHPLPFSEPDPDEDA